MALEVLPVEVGGVAVAVPPGAVLECRAVVLRVVVVQVLGGELHPIVLQERVACHGRGKKSHDGPLLSHILPSSCVPPKGLPWAPQ